MSVQVWSGCVEASCLGLCVMSVWLVDVVCIGCMAVTDDYMCGLEVMYVQELLGSVYA